LGTVVGEQQLGAVLDQGAALLLGARHEARHVHQGDQGDPEGVAEPHEPGRLARRIDVEDAGQHLRLVGDDAHRLAVHAGEPTDDVLGPVR
jgi:hypothetical protein